ncbi:MAG: aspartate--ammonia ligase, partial [Syntrophaceae bacterium]|nr:aspartate--ammonia ligase [Syntrophaceae bacterium]
MTSHLFIPKQYQPLLDLRETEKAIGQIKTFFQTNLSFELNLMRVTAPLFVRAGTGINDDLNGIERPVSFNIKEAGNLGVEMVQS